MRYYQLAGPRADVESLQRLAANSTSQKVQTPELKSCRAEHIFEMAGKKKLCGERLPIRRAAALHVE